MLQNYIRVALRNFFRNRLYTLVNMSGLALGITASLVIFLLVQYEYSFNRFHPGEDRIFRVVESESNAGDRRQGPGYPLPLIGAIEKEVTGIEAMAPMILGEEPVGSKDRQGIIFTNTDYFRLTPYTWLAGSPKTALSAANQVVLTAGRAAGLFPGVAPQAIIGRTLTYYDSIPMTVTGVVAGLDKPTDFEFQEFLSLSSMSDARLAEHFPLQAWGARSSDYELLLRLENGTAAATVRQQLQQLLHKYAPALNEGSSTFQFALEPLREIHLSNEYGSFSARKAHRDGLMGLMLLGGVLLTLACINFVNLTTAQATQRAREIGIRKTMGGSRPQLIVQFLCETLLLTTFAAAVGLLLTPLTLKVFAPFLPPGLPAASANRPMLIVFLVSLVTGVGFLSGFYPALVLSAFDPVKVLKGQSAMASGHTRRALLRKVLSVAQFVFAQLFLLFTLAASWQTRRLLHEDPGFRKEAVLSISLPAKSDSLKQLRLLLPGRFSRIPGVEAVSLAAEPPASNQFSGAVLTFMDGRKIVGTSVRLKFADTGYLRVYHIPLLAGRNVTPSDTMREVVINAAYARRLGFTRPADAVNQLLYLGTPGQLQGRLTVVGVMGDFHPDFTMQKVGAVALTAAASQCTIVHVALAPLSADGKSWAATIGKLEKGFHELYPGTDFQYVFLGKTMAAAYSGLQNLSYLLSWVTGVSIFISCLGMLGLVMFTTAQRTKEIGVRKVLGARVGQIVLLLSKDYIRMVVLATVIASGIAGTAIYAWLQNFSDRGLPPFWLFPLAALGMIGLTLAILSAQTVRAAGANPAESLRTE